MPERMVDVVRAVGEAVVDADADRLRRLLDPDVVIDSALGETSLTLDEFVELHTLRRPYLNWQLNAFEPLDAETAIVTATVTLRRQSGLALRRAVYLWRFRNRRVHRVTTHSSRDDAVSLAGRPEQPSRAGDPG